MYSTQIFAKTDNHLYVEAGNIYNDCVRFFVFQCRVKPDAITVVHNTNIMEPINDYYKHNEMEWLIHNPKDIIPYRLLYREISLQNYINNYKLKKLSK